ncbi:MAG TPA: nicotinate-nicotinamide nucleotide adenylyltransferase [Blastocatellia bacterium]|nr:nicotinate-nicotinamide nucleotide adenylyltransferase [Blastocatellia bacterium]
MDCEGFREIINLTGATGEPDVQFIKQVEATGPRLGVFASSFNPVTVAHAELMRCAAEQFRLDETLALAGKANADKSDYECSLAERLEMLALAFADDRSVSVGLSSHAYFVDMVEALERVRPQQNDLHFIVGFDTFERILDREDRYTARYHRRFANRDEALAFLLTRSRLIVAGRQGAGQNDIHALIADEPAWMAERILALDFPAEFGERSATEVRERVRAGLPVAGLVPMAVERYIQERGLYRP